MTTARWALLVSATAFAFSIYAWARGFGISRRMAAIEEARRDEELIEKASADIHAELVKEPRRGAAVAVEYKLVLTNLGKARAEGVALRFLNPEDALLTEDDMQEWLAFGLSPGQHVALRAVVTSGAPPIVEVEVTWTDGRGDGRNVVPLSIV